MKSDANVRFNLAQNLKYRYINL